MSTDARHDGVPWRDLLLSRCRRALSQVTAGERPPVPRTMPTSGEALLRKLWHGTAQMRYTFVDTLPRLEAIMEALPMGSSMRMGGGMPMDSLDSLAGLTLKPQRSR